MLRTIVVLFLLALGGFYVYQKQQEEIPVDTSTARVVDESALQSLQGRIPSVIFEKDILPVIERNRNGGLTPKELNELLDKLDTIGRALGDKATEAVNQAGHAIAPDLFPKKTLAQQAAGVAESLAQAGAEGAKSAMPVLKELAGDLLKALASALSFLLDKAADLIQGS